MLKSCLKMSDEKDLWSDITDILYFIYFIHFRLVITSHLHKSDLKELCFKSAVIH